MTLIPVSTSVQSGVTNTIKVIANDYTSKVAATDKTQVIPVTKAAVYETSEKQTTDNTKMMYTRESATLSEISKQVEAKLSNLRGIVENLITMQSLKTGASKGLNYDQIMKKYDGKLKEFYENIEVDESISLKAQEEISEDGFWGVKQTSTRAIDFAKALSGGDPAKIGLLRDAIEAGYMAAEKAWGGELPEICRQTQEATLKGLNDWGKRILEI